MLADEGRRSLHPVQIYIIENKISLFLGGALCWHLVTEAPSGEKWAHGLKFYRYRMHARIDRAEVRLLTRTGLDWTDKYPAIAASLRTVPVL